jgi:hypothetical protein
MTRPRVRRNFAKVFAITTASSSAASGRRLSFNLRYPQWDLRVACEGYQEFTAPFEAYERENPRFHDGNASPPHILPPVVIRLRKQEPAPRAREKR